jgi:hypothetical protein
VSGGRRCFAANTSSGPAPKGTSPSYDASRHAFAQTWLTDPGSYPIIFVLGFAVVFAGSFIFYKTRYCNDVRVTSSAKGHVLRTWA